MKIGRRTIVLLSGLVLLGIVAAAAVFLVVRDGDDDLPRYAGRVAVRDGCGVRHMFFTGEDERELCLPNLWAVLSVSQNGERIAWDTGTGISIANSDGFNPVAVFLPPGSSFAPSLSPDADEMAFLHSSRDDGRYDLWVGSTSLDNAEQVTNTRDVSTVAWSPTDGWIAYVKGWSEDTLEGDILLVRPDGSDERLLTRGDAPTWAPDGSRLAFVHGRAIWTIDADGSDARILVANGEAPAWARDGRIIAFMRAVPCGKPVCKERVFIVGATGGPARGIGPTFDGPLLPVWLPDPFE
jgi:Tol biopolymer transport system component